MAESTLDKENIPVHIGIIMDGNGRWAQKGILHVLLVTRKDLKAPAAF